jgi:hypothetical protein
MEKINIETHYGVFNFKLTTLYDQNPIISKILENNLKSINFEYHPKKWFFGKQSITLNLVYYMNDNFNLIKKHQKELVGKHFKIIGISNDESQILLYFLEIKRVLFCGLNPTQLDYGKTGRMCYSLKIKCEEI